MSTSRTGAARMPDDLSRAEPANTRQAIAHLRQLLGDRCSTAEALREQHGRGESYHPVAAPDAVCFPRSTGEVAEIVKLCARLRVPVIPFGAGTSLEGH